MNNDPNIKPVAIVLGGTLPHVTLVENLQQRGYYVILVDYYEDPKAKRIADEHLQESTLDKEKVLRIAQNRDARLVISTCIDQANVTACYVAEKLGLPSPYSYDTALSVTNKGLMKEKMFRNGIPTSKYVFVKDIVGFDTAGLRFPVAVKPADSNSSKGVRKACNYTELQKYLENALIVSRSDEAIIEEYKEGREIGVDCFVKNKKATVLMTKERRKVVIQETDDPIQQIYGCIWPADLAEKTNADFRLIADQIAHAFNLNNTPLMIQAIVNGDEINVIEFGARIGGGESFRIIKLSTGFDYVDAAVKSFLGLPVVLNHQWPERYYAETFIYALPGLFGHISGHESLLKDDMIDYLDSYMATGTRIGSEMSSNNRVGVFTVSADDKGELFRKTQVAIERLDVLNVHGESIMRNDIYCSGWWKDRYC